MVLILVSGMVVMGHRFGFKDRYSEVVNRMLRQHCNTPAEGDVQVYEVPSVAMASECTH